MNERERSRRDAEAGSRGPEPSPPTAESPQAAVLALQQTAGNAAVSRLVGQEEGAAPGGPLLTDGDAAGSGGAMPVRQFLDQLHEALAAIPEVTAGAEATGGIEAWLQRAAGGGAATLEAAIRRLLPGVTAGSPAELVSAVTARVQRMASGEGPPLPPAVAAEIGARAPVMTKPGPDAPAAGAAPHDVVERLGSGEPLPSDVRAPMEHAFGESFSGVRLHRDGDAAAVSRELSARAFAVGPHVAFGSGEYAPGTPVGDALIAHELAHVAQQRGADPTFDRKADQAEGAAPELEEDADRSAVQAVASIWGLARTRSAGWLQAAMPRLRSGLRLNRCGQQATAPTPAPAPAPPVAAPPAPYAWRNTTLKGMVDGTDTAAAIIVYIGTLSAADQAIAQEDLQQGRRDYADRGVLPDAVQKMNVVLQRLFRDIAVGQAPGVTAPVGGWPAGTAPPALTAGTHTPTSAERDRLRDAMVPPGQAPGALPDFHSTIATNPDSYETRVSRAIDDWVRALTAQLVTGKGPREHADPRKVNSWSRYEEVANVAKEEVDKVFGAYGNGPPFRHGTAAHPGNLMDRFEDEQASRAGQTPTEKSDQAKELVRYVIQSDDTIRTINHEHGAVVTRTTLSPGESEAEATILDRVVNNRGTHHEAALLDIDRGWEGVAVPGMVWLQRWRRPTRAGQREHFWDTLQIMMHEYIHTLEHPAYRAYALSQPGGAQGLQYNTLIEGMCSAFTETAWANVRITPAMARRVEGRDRGTAADTAAAVPDVSNRRYGSFNEAMAMISVVGPRNAYAAYFLGEVDLVRGS